MPIIWGVRGETRVLCYQRGLAVSVMCDTWHVCIPSYPHPSLQLVFHRLFKERMWIANMRHFWQCWDIKSYMETCCCSAQRSTLRGCLENADKCDPECNLGPTLHRWIRDGYWVQWCPVSTGLSIKVWSVELLYNPHSVPCVSWNRPFVFFFFVSQVWFNFLAVASSGKLHPSPAWRAPSFYLVDRGVSIIMQVKSSNWNQLCLLLPQGSESRQCISQKYF